jgi:sugar/nucleoside kinase (ribokinase family)
VLEQDHRLNPRARTAGFFIGDVAMDEYFKVPRWPTIKEKVDVEIVGSFVGGTIANAAAVYAGFGDHTYFVSALNSGTISARLQKSLTEARIDISFVRIDDELPDSRTLVFLVENEHVVFLPAMGNYIPAISAGCFQEMQEAAFIYSSVPAIRQLSLEHAATDSLTIMDTLRRSGVKVILDLDVADFDAEDARYYSAASVLLLNEVGVASLSSGGSEADLMAQLLGGAVEIVVVTRAASGCSVYTQGAGFSVAGCPVDVADVTGAGDTFGGAFAFGLTRTADLRLAASFANAAAARGVTRIGAQGGIGDVRTILEFMSSQGMSTTGFAKFLAKDR